MSDNIKSIIVFGASTKVGKSILERGVQEELEVTAFVEKSDDISKKLRDMIHRTIEGDILDEQYVEKVIEGHDAVLSALESDFGWFRGSYAMSESCQNIVNGMKKHGMKKIAVVGTSSMFEPRRAYHRFPWGEDKDHIKQVKILENEYSLDWIIMMPPNIKNSSKVDPNYKVQKDSLPGASTVTAGEVADFMVRVFKDTQSIECFRHSKLGISTRQNSKFTLGFFVCIFFAGLFAYAGWQIYNDDEIFPPIIKQFLDQIQVEKYV